MKLLKLNLKAVGPFSGLVLDLSSGREGLHLIYGRNEAGKTSALRAISHLFFGFPHLSADNFVHPNEQLRVGGLLRHSDGEELEIVRRRGRGNTVRGSDDSLVIADAWQRRFLGDLNQETFRDALRDRSRTIVEGRGGNSHGQGRLGRTALRGGCGDRGPA